MDLARSLPNLSTLAVSATTARDVRAPLRWPQAQDERHDFGREGHTDDVE